MTPSRAYATVTGPTATYTGPDGHTEPVTATGTGTDDIRVAVVQRAADEARRTGAPVELVTTGDRGDHHLLVHTDGAVTAYPDTPPLPDTAAATPPPKSSSILAEVTMPELAIDAHPVTGAERIKDAAPEGPRRRSSFIADPATMARPQIGWRGILARAGIRVAPSRAEQQRAADREVVSRQCAGCRTIAVVNGKGGVGKTMTTAMLAAVYARFGGGNVLAWDNNDTRGTLGWRTEQGLYDTTLRDLLPATEQLLASGAGVSDVTRFVHHQAADRYDVLRSNPELLAADQRISTTEFDRLMQVASRFYRLVIFDSGNDESAPRWLRMIDDATQLVVPTLADPESAESAALLLDALTARDEHSARLAAGAVVVVTQSEPGADTRRIQDGFEGTVRAVVTVPFDAGLKAGPLRFDGLRPRTRDAWTSVAAAAAAGL